MAHFFSSQVASQASADPVAPAALVHLSESNNQPSAQVKHLEALSAKAQVAHPPAVHG